MSANGRFVWFDLVSDDMAKARPFYTQAVGWKTTRWPGSDYEMWSAGETPIGGVMAATELPGPPRWLGYVSVDSLDAIVKRAQAMGGRVLRPAKGTAKSPQYAVLADPEGAAFGVYQNPKAGTPPDRKAMGQIGWVELNTGDWRAALRFYSELFGWKLGAETEDHALFGPDAVPDHMLGGMSKMQELPAGWIYYANVSDTDAVVKEIPTLGGKLVSGPLDTSGGARIARCMDAQGAPFGVITPAKE